MTQARYTLTSTNSTLPATQNLADAIESDLRFDPLAIAINETDEAAGLWAVVSYFESASDVEAARQAFGGAVAELIEQDWVRQSLEGLAPVTAGRFFLHGSHDRHRRRPGGVPLEIDAGLAFGTGHHGTTEGCLLALDAILKRKAPRRILDVGCGTGVLAIAAAKATGRPALASDIDPEAVRVTLANARLNGVAPRIRSMTAAGIKHPAIVTGAPYDLVFANILARPLVALAQNLSSALAPDGSLILSGLTLDQMRWIEATYVSRGLALTSRITRGNWATLVFGKVQRIRRPGGRTSGRLAACSKGAGWEVDA